MTSFVRHFSFPAFCAVLVFLFYVISSGTSKSISFGTLYKCPLFNRCKFTDFVRIELVARCLSIAVNLEFCSIIMYGPLNLRRILCEAWPVVSSE